MIGILQVISFFVLVSLFVFWGSWVYETRKSYPIPQKLGVVSVHGIDAAKSELIGRTLALGVSGTIAEHFRTVDRINKAADTAGQDLIITTGPPPEPLLLASTANQDPISISVEFGGAKLDSKGLARLVSRDQNDRASLNLSVSLIPLGETGEWNATASASYGENNAYGFLSHASGSIDDIASAIAMRFVQAHYATSDAFHNALPAEDFIKFWEIRSEAGHMALRAVSGGTETAEELKQEAQRAYETIDHLFKRYKGREDFQKLALYLSQVAGRLPDALKHARHVRQALTDSEEQAGFDKLIEQLEATIAQRKAATKASEVEDVLPEVTTEALNAQLDVLRGANAGAYAALQLNEIEDIYPPSRAPRIGVVSAKPYDVWLQKIHKVVGSSRETNDSVFKDFSSQVISILVSSAPEAEIVLSIIDGGSGGSASQTDLVAALERLNDEDVDVILFPYGVTIRRLHGPDALDLWKDSTELFIDSAKNAKGLLILAAGNDETELPDLNTEGSANYLIVGGFGEDGSRAPLSNYGATVDTFAPFDNISTTTRGNTVSKISGTSNSATFAAIAVARLAAMREDPIDATQLRAVIKENSVPQESRFIPNLLAAAEQLQENQ